jgi:hypothetical protein
MQSNVRDEPPRPAGLIERVASGVENLFGSLLIATTSVAWLAIMSDSRLLTSIRGLFPAMLAVWAGTFCVIELWEEGIARVLAGRRLRALTEQRLLDAAAQCGGRLTRVEAKRACPSLSLAETGRFLRRLVAEGYSVPTDDDEDAYEFPGLKLADTQALSCAEGRPTGQLQVGG